MPAPPGPTLEAPLFGAGWQVLNQETALGVYNSLTVTQVLRQTLAYPDRGIFRDLFN